MRKLLFYLGSLIVIFYFSYFMITWLIMPVISHYERLWQLVNRFSYTPIILVIMLTITLWLFLIQYRLKQFSVYYLYIVYTCYLILLFTVLFTKATNYHALSLNPFDFIKNNPKTLKEALLNVIYFIPLGGLYGINTNRKQFIAISLTTLLLIESIQFVFYLGTFAVSDVILNFLGCLMGYWVCWRVERGTGTS
ncbi:VanZ family protein [Lactococcus hodotermopsidis]|uniref:VanZ family protein n=1 Tax=Pseudolactococcus hodotermopsidis TaxID=2709157 RepID=UPI00155197FD|nr:VanZ family protein [Lactococcus hodotermopsidis]